MRSDSCDGTGLPESSQSDVTSITFPQLHEMHWISQGLSRAAMSAIGNQGPQNEAKSAAQKLFDYLWGLGFRPS